MRGCNFKTRQTWWWAEGRSLPRSPNFPLLSRVFLIKCRAKSFSFKSFAKQDSRSNCCCEIAGEFVYSTAFHAPFLKTKILFYLKRKPLL